MRRTHGENRDNAAIITIGADLSSILAYDLCKELHHPTMSMIWGYGGRLYIEREIILFKSRQLQTSVEGFYLKLFGHVYIM